MTPAALPQGEQPAEPYVYCIKCGKAVFEDYGCWWHVMSAEHRPPCPHGNGIVPAQSLSTYRPVGVTEGTTKQ